MRIRVAVMTAMVSAAALAQSYATIPGQGMLIPASLELTSIYPQWDNANATLNVTGAKVSFCGAYWNKDWTSKNIRRVGFRLGAVAKTGGSGLTISLQDVSASGPPMQPDGTQDQTVAAPSSGITAYSWYRSGALSADRSLSIGAMVCVVVEFDGSGRQGSDSFQLTSLRRIGHPHQALEAYFNGASWAAVGGWPNVVLEDSDGGFGGLMGGMPVSGYGTLTYQSGSAPDEYALRFQLPFGCQVSGAVIALNASTAAADFQVVLYDGATALETVTVDANQLWEANYFHWLNVLWPPRALSANHDYYISVKPAGTGSDTVSIAYVDVADANQFQAHGGGTNFVMASRVDAGAWTATATRRPLVGVVVASAVAASGGGGAFTWGN